jgi:predicted small metal-binding protein
MAVRLECNDVFPGCDAIVNTESEEELMTQVIEHASSVHGLEEVDSATAEKVKAAIRQV